MAHAHQPAPAPPRAAGPPHGPPPPARLLRRPHLYLHQATRLWSSRSPSHPPSPSPPLQAGTRVTELLRLRPSLRLEHRCPPSPHLLQPPRLPPAEFPRPAEAVAAPGQALVPQ